MNSVLMIGGFDHIISVAHEEEIPLTVFQKPCDVTAFQRNLANLHIVDTSNIEYGAELARSIHRRQPFAGVISFVEHGLELAGHICDDLLIAGNPSYPISVTRDKLRMRELLAEHGFPSARFRRCESIIDLIDFYREVQSPLVVKPSHGCGTEGVMFADQRDDLERAWSFAAALGHPAVLAEEYLEGSEILVATQTLDDRHEIIAIEEQFTTEKPYFIETGHQTPAQLAPETEEDVRRIVLMFLDLIGHRYGPCHVELRLTATGPRIIECNTRPAGDFSWEMQLRAYGVDLFRETLLHLSAGRRPYRRAGIGAAATRFFIYENRTVAGVEGVETAAALPGVVRVTCRARPGDVLGPLRTESRQGHVLATGRTTDEAATLAEAARAMVRFRFVEEPGDEVSV